jgi:hypothetical protein
VTWVIPTWLIVFLIHLQCIQVHETHHCSTTRSRGKCRLGKLYNFVKIQINKYAWDHQRPALCLSWLCWALLHIVFFTGAFSIILAPALLQERLLYYTETHPHTHRHKLQSQINKYAWDHQRPACTVLVMAVLGSTAHCVFASCV